MLILAVTIEDEWKEAKLFFSKKDFRERTKSAEVVDSVEMAIRGKTYKERQASLRDVAVNVQAITWDPAFLDAVWHLEGDLMDFFETHGARYGLLAEFRENAII